MAYALNCADMRCLAVVCGAAHAVAYRAYAIRPYIYTVCNRKTTYAVHIIPAPPQSGCFPELPEKYIGRKKSYIGHRKNYIRRNSNYIKHNFCRCKPLRNNNLHSLVNSGQFAVNQRLVQISRFLADAAPFDGEKSCFVSSAKFA